MEPYWIVSALTSACILLLGALWRDLGRRLKVLEDRPFVTPELCRLRHNGTETMIAAALKPIEVSLAKLSNGGSVDMLSGRVERLESKVEVLEKGD